MWPNRLDGSRHWLAGASAYGDSKLANAVFARELHNRYSGQGLLAFSVDPGEIMTGIASAATPVLTPVAHRESRALRCIAAPRMMCVVTL